MPIYEKLMGNPFVDAGVCGICEWLGRSVQPEQITTDDLEEVVNDIAPMMQTDAGWNNLYGIFPNGVLTNPSFSKCKTEKCRIPNKCVTLDTSYSKCNRVELFKNLCAGYLNTIIQLGQSGDCMGCGRREANAWLSRTNIPMTGGENSNFFPTFSKGAGYCGACAFAIQLSPLVFMATAGKFLTLYSNSWKALRSWAQVCVKDVRSQQLQQDVTGCFNPGYKNPRNGMFYMARKMAQYREMRTDENISIQVYCWTNYNQGPELEVFYMPAPVFKFLRNVYQSGFNTAWQEIVRAGYGSKVNWDKVKSEEDYKNRTNRVYENLLQDISILGYFLNRRIRKPRGNWELLTLYLKEVRTMELTQLEKIKQVGDLIAECIQESGSNKRLTRLEGAKSYEACRTVLLYIIRERIKQGTPTPLFSLDDYVKHLFPESEDFTATPWRETRDLLLFRIYERLHNWLQDEGFVDFDEDNTPDSDDESDTE